MVYNYLHNVTNLVRFLILSFCLTLSFTQKINASDIPITSDSRIRTLVYNPNEVYQLKFHYGFQSFIEFSENEEIEVMSIGKSYPWRITPIKKRVFIRPLQVGAHTNMTIVTTKRTYHFDLYSGIFEEGSDEELVYVVRFYYPPENALEPDVVPYESIEKDLFDRKVEEVKPETEKKEIGDIINSKDINLDYSIAGYSEEIEPLKVFDDGISTYFQFKENISVPQISSVDNSGREIPLEYEVQDKFVIINSIEPQFSIRLGRKLICVFNNIAI